MSSNNPQVRRTFRRDHRNAPPRRHTCNNPRVRRTLRRDHRDAPPAATQCHHLQQLATRPPPATTCDATTTTATHNSIYRCHTPQNRMETQNETQKPMFFLFHSAPPFKTTQFCFFKKKTQLDSPTRTRVASPHRVYRFHTESTEFTSKPSLLPS